MKPRPITRAEAREIDLLSAKAGLSTLVLMENAGRGAADILRREIPPPTRVLFVCGTGNNGGDAAVMARHLDAAGYPTALVAFRAGRFADDALTNFEILGRNVTGTTYDASYRPYSREELDALLAESDWVVDGLFGTGLDRPVEGQHRAVIEAMNRSGKPILALDLPSGMDADTGEPLGIAVRATITATFVAPKAGFGHPDAESYTGRVEVVEIGAPRKILERIR